MTARAVSLPAMIHDRPAPDARGDVIGALRRELERTEEPGARALLHHHLGRLLERRGLITEATQEYLEATNLAPGDLAPLESLIGLAVRRGSPQNLGPLLERLERLAEPGSRRQEAFLVLSELQRRQGQSHEARQTIERWLEELPEDAAAWLALDVLASQTRDAALQERARMGRAATAQDHRWRALLLLDCAGLRAAAGDSTTALDLCRQAHDEHATLTVLTEWERCAVALECWAEASDVAERAATLLRDCANETEALDRLEASSAQRSQDHVALLLLRAAEWARREGHLERALSLFDRCAGERPTELLPRLAQLLCRRDGPEGPTRVTHLETEIERVGPGPVAAALWLDLADAAKRGGDHAGQRRALDAALRCHPTSLRARALHLDIVERTGTTLEAAATLARLVDDLGSAQADWLLGAALIAALPDPTGPKQEERLGQVRRLLDAAHRAEAAPREDLADAPPPNGKTEPGDARPAEEHRTSPTLAHVQATLAHLLGDRASFESSLASLAQIGSPAARLDAALGLVRARLLARLRDAGAELSMEASSLEWEELLAPGSEGHPLSVLLRAAVLPLWTRRRSAEDSFPFDGGSTGTDTAARLRRGALLVTLRRLIEEGDLRGAKGRLYAILKEEPGDLAASALLADVLASEEPTEAATVLAAAARHPATDREIRSAWLLRAGRLLWQGKRPAEALATLREIEALAPEAVAPWLEWGSRRLEPDAPAERARLLDRCPEDRAHFATLERLTLAIRRGELVQEPPPAAPNAGDGPSTPGPVSTGYGAHGSAPHAEALWLTSLMRAAYSPADEVEPWLAFGALPGAPAGLGQVLRHGAFSSEPVPSLRGLVTTAARWARDAPTSIDGALAWLVASRDADDLDEEIQARSELGVRLRAPELGAGAALLARLTGSSRAEELTLALAQQAEREPPESLRGRLLQWACVELAPPGGDTAGRASALERLAKGKQSLPHDAGGAPSEVGTLLTMAGFARLRANDAGGAVTAFRQATEVLPDDLGGWEGLRAGALALQDQRLEAEACTELARRTYDPRRAAAFWERAGVLHQTSLGEEELAEEAFAAALAQDFSRETAFERLYLIVRARGDEERLLDLLEGRLGVVDDPGRVGELLWEKARLARKLNRLGPALRSLEQLLELQPEHLGALALTCELCLRERLHERAVTCLIRLANLEQAPEQQRLLAGLTAADLLEQKLGRPEQALSVLRALDEAGLAAGGPDGDAVTERLGFCALRAGRFEEAAAAFEVVLAHADSPSRRAEAAAFLLALYRDQLPASHARRLELATRAARALLAEKPTDPDALAFLVDEAAETDREPHLQRALDELRDAAKAGPLDAARLELVAQLAEATGARRTALAAHGSLHLLGRLGPSEAEDLAAFTRRFPRAPRNAAQALVPQDLEAIASPREAGPFLSAASLLSGACVRRLEPGLDALRVRPTMPGQELAALDPALDAWAQVFGVGRVNVRRSTLADRVFVLAGTDVAGTEPTLVLGDELRTPLDDRRRARAVGALYTLTRGTAVFVQRDEATAARLMASVALAVGAQDLARALEPDEKLVRALSDQVRSQLEDGEQERLFGALSEAPSDRGAFADWYWGARLSALRASALALGEPSHLRSSLAEMVAQRGEREAGLLDSDPHLPELIAFTLSAEFAALREALGLEEA